ncbi:ABC transporter ATP-binding protein [Paenibacillus rhizovicinus]|uniref:ABC transporter ATP-binding protein n=1 Tax=Paenibacillus rhizovicinus TaxID=2704463 RepID=A0A6C0P4W3_9BACL|nr:ABC transporter ATP-binding protein [Paenibacillus rhizovicinus]QHW33485.1 ABC transporter ATP-binding protein [Paenibacillus rhizovicinus]
MWLLKSYLKPYWKSALFAPLLMLLEVSMDLLQPTLMARIVNDGIGKGNLGLIQSTGLWMVIVALIGLIGGAGCTVYSTMASQNFGADLRNGLFQHVQKLSVRRLDELHAGSLITRLTNDVTQVQTFVQMMLRMIRSPLLVIGSLVMAVMISLKLTLILAVAVPALFLVLFVLIRTSFPLFTSVQSKLDRVNTVLQENLSGIRVVKSFVRADYERQRFARANQDFTGIAIKAGRIVALNMPFMMLIMNVSTVAVLWYGGAATWKGSLPVGDLIAFINYVTQLLFSMLMLGNMLSFIPRAQASAVRIQEVLDMEPEHDQPENEAPLAEAALRSGQIIFDNVSFAYDNDRKDYVLRNISFRAEPGQTVAILGATGAGKSSLVHLIPRFYDATEGRVIIDGCDVGDIPLDALRNRIGIVLQQTILFSGKIRDNISFGRPEATLEEIEAAAKAAAAHAFIRLLPDGYDTDLNQRGVNLSGGQKQRIAIARALLMQPDILILDDSTSALDLGTESRIQKALRTMMKQSTNLIIAQRISSVVDADKILVLDQGIIVAEGTHEQLLQSSAIYQDIYRSQWNEEDVSYVNAR